MRSDLHPAASQHLPLAVAAFAGRAFVVGSGHLMVDHDLEPWVAEAQNDSCPVAVPV